jgi:hypothetical protein
MRQCHAGASDGAAPLNSTTNDAAVTTLTKRGRVRLDDELPCRAMIACSSPLRKPGVVGSERESACRARPQSTCGRRAHDGDTKLVRAGHQDAAAAQGRLPAPAPSTPAVTLGAPTRTDTSPGAHVRWRPNEPTKANGRVRVGGGFRMGARPGTGVSGEPGTGNETRARGNSSPCTYAATRGLRVDGEKASEEVVWGGGNARGGEKKERKDVSTVVIVTHILAASAAAGGLGQVECLVWLGARMPTR